MKRGFFFSLMTFLLLFSILLFSADYISRSKQLQNSLADSRVSNKLVYIEDDVIDGSLEGLTGIRVNSITRTAPSILLNFSGGLIDGTDYPARMEAFSDFVSHNYSVLSNVEIVLENFTAGFYVEPFNSTYLLDTDRAVYATEDFGRLNGIEIRARLDVTGGELISNSTPAGSGDRNITLRVYDINGALIMDKTANLNPSLKNSPFLMSFGSGKTFGVWFGDYGWNGAMIMNVTGLSAEVEEMIVDYDYTDEDVIAGNGAISLYSPIGELAKEREIVLKRG